MAIEDLLRSANENKPADFSKEFKTQLDNAIKKRLNPVSAQDSVQDDAGGDGDDE